VRSIDPAKLTAKQKEDAIARALARIERSLIRDGKLARRAPVSDEERRRRLEQDRAAREEWAKEPPWFLFFDPYVSVIATDEPAFRAHDGTPLHFRKGTASFAHQLLTLAIEAAKEAFPAVDLRQQLTREQWKNALANSKHHIAAVREEFPFESIQFKDALGKPVKPPRREDIDAFNLLWIMHQSLGRTNEAEALAEFPEALLLLRTLWCMVALKEMDTVVLALLYEDAGNGGVSAILATQAIANAKSLLFTSQLPFKHSMALQGARAKLERDPKQFAKRHVKELWKEWWHEQRDRYRSKTRFAKDMLDKFPELANQAVIVRWCTGWEKEKK